MGTEDTNISKQEGKTERKSKLEKIIQRITQLENQKKAIQARKNEKKRKQRTRQLIQIGAIAIHYLGCPNDIEPHEFEEKIKRLVKDVAKNG